MNVSSQKKLRLSAAIGVLTLHAFMLSACNETAGTAGLSSGSASSTLTTASSSSSYTGINAFQIITKAGGTGSFNATAVPASGGTTATAQRLFELDGSLIPTASIPTWFTEAKVFLTSSRTSGGSPAYSTSDTPCSYFDSYSADNNPDSDGYYTIDGYNVDAVASDIDQCAGTTASELNKLSLHIKLDRRFMNSTDKIQLIIKAKPIDAPNTAPTASSCVVGGAFDAGNCSNQYFAVTLRTDVYAPAQPFFILFPSAKSYDLLSESLLLPIQIDSDITTISIDRVKGGAIFYGLTVLRLL